MLSPTGDHNLSHGDHCFEHRDESGDDDGAALATCDATVFSVSEVMGDPQNGLVTKENPGIKWMLRRIVGSPIDGFSKMP